MKTRSNTQRVLVTTGFAVVLCLAVASPASAQCEPEEGEVCVPFIESCICAPVGETVTCPPFVEGFSTCAVPFTPDADTWTLVFDENNAIKIGTTVTCDSFVLVVDAIQISQEDYANFRRDNTQFADTVCNPTADPLVSDDCVFYRLHGEFVPTSCYPDSATAWDYSIFWNIPPIQGNKHDWMLLRARCSENATDHLTNPCNGTQLFSENTTVMLEKKPPVGTDPVVRGTGDGISDFIVAISTRHPHKGIPPLIPPLI